MPNQKLSDKDIQKAFFAVANTRNSKAFHGRWIPAVYWAYLVQLELKRDDKIKESKLTKAIETHAATYGLNHQGIITMVKTNKTRVRSRKKSEHLTLRGTKERQFIRVDTNQTLHDPDPFKNCSIPQVNQFFQESYTTYANKIPSRRSSIGATWVRNLQQNNNPDEVEALRVVTPENAPPEIELDANKDIKELLDGILDPNALKRNDLFIGDAPFDELRERIRKLGLQYQMKANEATYTALAPNDPLSENVELQQKYAPVLRRFCLPLIKRAFQAVIGTALKIESEHESGIFQLNNFGGKAEEATGKKLVTIVPAKNKAALYKNGKRWMPHFYNALTAPTADDLDLYTISYQLILLHKRICPQAFVDLCMAVGPRRESFKLNPYRQIAMCKQANLNTEHLRVMRPFLNADKCNPLNSERQMIKLNVSPQIEPIFLTVVEDGEKRDGWHLPCDQVATEELTRDPTKAIDEVHVLLSADHGQHAFRCNLAVIAINQQSEKPIICVEANRLVGQIDCKHDTYELIADSGLAKGLNQSLMALKNNRTLGIPIKLKGVADLSFLSLACGKPNMSGSHCWRCNAMHSEFQKNPFYLGKEWTVSEMKETLQKLEDGMLDWNKPSQARGLVHDMLFDCIEPADWIVPVLHAVVLLTNTVFKQLQRWLWYRMEDVAVDLIRARLDHAEALNKKEDLWTEVLDATRHLTKMRDELDKLKPTGNDFDDDDHELEFKTQKEVVKLASVALKAKEEKHKEATKEVREAWNIVKALEKSDAHGKTKQDLWLDIQRMLKEEFNVYMSVYHGGSFEGNQARTLLRKAPEVMERMKSMLLEYLDTLEEKEKAKRADAAEIDLFVGGFQRLFQYMDLIAHYGYQPYGSMSDADLGDAKKAIILGTKLWKLLMPTVPMKVHAWQHLAEDLEKYRGLKSHSDEQIERCHQAGKKDNHRLHAVRNYQLKTLSVLKTNATVAQEEVEEMMNDTKAKIKRRKRKAEHTTQSNRPGYLRSILVLPEITETFPSVLELNKALKRDIDAKKKDIGDLPPAAAVENNTKKKTKKKRAPAKKKGLISL